MSSLATAPPIKTDPLRKTPSPRRGPYIGRRLRRWLIAVVLLAGIAAGGIYIYRRIQALSGKSGPLVPTAAVERGDVKMDVTARGELRGGNPESLAAPLTGGAEMHITFLRKAGEPVKANDVIVQFDTTEQEYKLKEAQADVAEAEQHILQATAQREADREEDRYALSKAQTDVTLAELDVRKNPLLAAITAKENDLALTSAREHLAQVRQNLANRQATGEAGIAIQQAGKAKAEAQAATAQQNIDAMTLRTHRAGYVSIKQNSGNNGFMYAGMVLPLYQIGDAVRPGMPIAEIPDLQNWEIAANIGELDRGHLTVGDKVAVTVVAEPGRKFHGRVKQLGGTMGPFWNRHFECTISLDDPIAALRPGMSTDLVVTTETMHGVLWIPAQALFESDGRTFVYVKRGKTFTAQNVQLVRRNDTRAVISGLKNGEIVALSNPVEAVKAKDKDAGPLKTVGK